MSANRLTFRQQLILRAPEKPAPWFVPKMRPFPMPECASRSSWHPHFAMRNPLGQLHNQEQGRYLALKAEFADQFKAMDDWYLERDKAKELQWPVAWADLVELEAGRI